MDRSRWVKERKRKEEENRKIKKRENKEKCKKRKKEKGNVDILQTQSNR
jgi:hypothetical protein